MGVFTKLKGIFYDEVVVDEDENIEEKPIKKEVIKEEKPKIEEIKLTSFEEEIVELDNKEISKKETHNERDLFRSERTFNFTELEDEEEKLPPRKNVLNVENRSVLKEPAKPIEQKVFKPSPVISPIYGILDKDYKKEEIKQRENVSNNSPSLTTYDSVRRKAYGTLEDDLEDTLNSMNKISTNTINSKINDDKVKDNLEKKSKKIEDLIEKIEETTNEIDKEISVGELEDKVEIDNFEEDYNDKTMTGNTLEHDLFNLIDSMYDDKED